MEPVPVISSEEVQVEEFRDIFPFLSSAELSELGAYLKFGEWREGEVVMCCGMPGDFIGFLLTGRLAVKKEAIFPGRFVMLALLERGSLVGELAAVAGRRQATVTAIEDCRMLTLSRSDLALLLNSSPVLGQKVLLRIIHILGHRLDKANERLARLL